MRAPRWPGRNTLLLNPGYDQVRVSSCKTPRGMQAVASALPPTCGLGGELRGGAVQLRVQVRQLRRQAGVLVAQPLPGAVQPLPVPSGLVDPEFAGPNSVDCWTGTSSSAPRLCTGSGTPMATAV